MKQLQYDFEPERIKPLSCSRCSGN